MNPAMLAMIFALVEEAIKVEPQVAAGLKSIFSKADPTPADWETLRANVLAKSYADYVPASALPATAAAAPVPPVATVMAEKPVVATPDTQSNALQEAPSASETAKIVVLAANQPYLPNGDKNPDFVESQA